MERRAAEEAKESKAEQHSSSPSSSSSSSSSPQPPLDSSDFTPADAVWLRQALSRWRFYNGAENTAECRLSRVDAWRAYNVKWSQQVGRWATWDFHPSTRLVDVAGHLFQRYGHASRMPRRFHRDGFLHAKADRYRQWAEEEVARRRAALKWEACSNKQPFLLQLHSAVTLHFILFLLDFETLMLLRVVSHSSKPLFEQAAVLWLNQSYSTGLIVARRKIEEARLRQQAEEVKAIGRKRKRSGDAEGEGEVTTPRKRESRAVANTASSSAVSATSATSASSADAAILSHDIATPPSLSSSSSSSPTSFLTIRSTSSPSTATSYTVADAVWVMRQLNWARSLRFNAKKRPNPFGVEVAAEVCKTEGVDRFAISADTWLKRFGPSAKVDQYGRGATRWDVMDVVDVVFSIHADSAGVREAKRRRTMRSKKLQQAASQRKADEIAATKAALQAANVAAYFGDESFFSGRVWFKWHRKSGWYCSHYDRPRWDEDELDYDEKEEARLHEVMYQMGLHCKAYKGGCGWGGCFVR